MSDSVGNVAEVKGGQAGEINHYSRAFNDEIGNDFYSNSMRVVEKLNLPKAFVIKGSTPSTGRKIK
ncbi:MAG: hypothetical protein O2951_14435 [Bacteroidetes bacterium]|nr:hypothetical protein [Bacteroidota bacterium]